MQLYLHRSFDKAPSEALETIYNRQPPITSELTFVCKTGGVPLWTTVTSETYSLFSIMRLTADLSLHLPNILKMSDRITVISMAHHIGLMMSHSTTLSQVLHTDAKTCLTSLIAFVWLMSVSDINPVWKRWSRGSWLMEGGGGLGVKNPGSTEWEGEEKPQRAVNTLPTDRSN